MLKLGQFQVKWVEMGHLSEDTGPALGSLGLGEADSPGNSPCERGRRAQMEALCFTHANSLNPHDDPARKAPPSSSSVRCRNRGPAYPVMPWEGVEARFTPSQDDFCCRCDGDNSQHMLSSSYIQAQGQVRPDLISPNPLLRLPR